MKSHMLPAEHHAAVQRALALGRTGDPAALSELVALSARPANEVQRLAASAIGKLASFGADAEAAVAALVPLALRGRHPQTQPYALRALKAYANAAEAHLHNLRDLRLVRRIYWPMLRGRADDVRGYLRREFGDLAEPAILSGGSEDRGCLAQLDRARFDGVLTFEHDPHRGVQLTRRLFPSPDEPAVVEHWRGSMPTASPPAP